MQQRVLLTVIAALAAVVGFASGGSAAGPTSCTFTVDLTMSPGLSHQGTSGTLDSGGQTGTVNCDGPVDGHQPTGPGTFGTTGRYGTQGPDGCATGGEGDGTQDFTLPTAGSSTSVRNTMTFNYGAKDGGVGGDIKGDRYSGTFEVRPKKGDCFNSPVTEITISGSMTSNS